MRQKSHKMEKQTTKWVLGHKITTHATDGDYDLMMAETPPQMQGPPPHYHAHFKETFLIVEGEMDFVINGETRKVKTGESISLPPNTVHTFSNNSTSSCKWINIHSPKGFTGFFDALGIPAERKSAREDSLTPECIQKVMKIANDFDMIITV
ncbi:cupin domain-containing protein [uncultured Altibacter sp.]|uniref:cupin domain-containing protein n=1 Tax=uncultured Altibacter sp. TaxID=2506933 RepID=UPI0030DBEF74